MTSLQTTNNKTHNNNVSEIGIQEGIHAVMLPW